jgi:hypothetical protein
MSSLKNKQVSKVELAEFLAKEGAYEVFDATEVTEVMTRFDKDGNGFLRYRSSGSPCYGCCCGHQSDCK